MGLCLQINFHFKNVTKFKISSDAEVCDRQKEGNATIQRENNEKEKKQKEQQSDKYIVKHCYSKHFLTSRTQTNNYKPNTRCNILYTRVA